MKKAWIWHQDQPSPPVQYLFQLFWPPHIRLGFCF